MPADDRQDEDVEGLRPWLHRLGGFAGRDTLLQFAATKYGTIDLTHAHPSGLAQLLAGRRTRLSTLLRDPDQYQVALRAARLLRAKIFELGSEHGIDAGYLAAGTASWRSAGAGTSGMLNTPVLLSAISLTVRSGHDEYELQLTEQARVNPALIRQLEREHGIVIDPDALARMAYNTARFDPHPVLEKLRTLTGAVRGMAVEYHLYAASFADLTENLNDPAIRPSHPVISALARATTSQSAAAAPQTGEHRFLGSDERDPNDEFLLLDADSTQQEVLDLVSAGESLVVSAPPGTGQTQTALNTVASLAYAGKSVLVIGERRGTLNQFVERLDEQQLGSLVLQLGANLNRRQLTEQLVRAVKRNERAEAPQLESLHQTLLQTRHQLLDHVDSLHNIRQRWGCSPYQAMQSLARLISIDPAPATAVRLKRSVLDSIADRSEVAVRLRRAAELGSFSRAAAESPWYGAKLMNRQETTHAHQLAEQLAVEVQDVHTRMVKVAAHSQIGLGATFTEWGVQLNLLVAVRASLDKFTPDIFDRSVTDLISATGSSAWRREHGVDMSAMNRSRLRRVAKEYVRPGVHISDLHSSLMAVQEQRTVWADYATSQRHPVVPSGLAELESFHRQVGERLAELETILADTPGGGGVADLDHESCLDRLRRLAADKQTLETLPERTLLTENMREHGLGDLLDDLAAREVGADSVAAELDLAWWQSALEAMISGDDYLAMSDGESLRRLEADYRLADNAHVASGPARLRWQLARRWHDELTGNEGAADGLRALLKTGDVGLEALAGQSQHLIRSLVPVWTASPLILPTILPQAQRFDAVVILDAESSALASVLPAIGRSSQVVAFGDGLLGAPRTFTVGVDEPPARPGRGGSRPEYGDPTRAAQQQTDQPDPSLEQASPDPIASMSAFDALSLVLPDRGLSVAYRSVDESLVRHLSESFYSSRLERLPDGHAVTGTPRGLSVEYLADGTGMPTPGQDGVESVAAEVNRVVDLVFEFAKRHPLSSLAVVTASHRHAARVGEAIRLQMANYPYLEEFFSPGRESFRVVPLERAAGMVRDSIIFSLGFGRTPHGRALHSFGPLSSPSGRGMFVTAMTRARSKLHVVTCFRPQDLDPSRLTYGALDLYHLLERELAGVTVAAAVTQPSRRALDEDPLVADLAGRLRERGAKVWHDFDQVIDVVAAADPLDPVFAGEIAELPRPVAIESDGTEQYQGMSVRERSRLRPQLLERLGWRYVPLWTIEVFTDPEACARLIGEYLGLAPLPQDKAHEKAQDKAHEKAHDKSQDKAHEAGSQVSASGQPDGLGREPARDAAAGHPDEDESQGKTTQMKDYGMADGSTDGRVNKSEPLLPRLSEKDSAEAWGDRNDDQESWLREQRPPHWG